MSEEIASHLIGQYPALRRLIAQAGILPKLSRRRLPIPEAVVKVTIGQMLSGTAARTIYKRVLLEARKRGLQGSWLLPEAVLFECGLSRRKIRTIKEFAKAYRANSTRIKNWPKLDGEDLFREVNSFWGMSDWTASMLGIFYFAHEDIFPYTDGSLQRAIVLLEKNGYRSRRAKRIFDPEQARPYRSYLALYLWKALDSKLLE